MTVYKCPRCGHLSMVYFVTCPKCHAGALITSSAPTDLRAMEFIHAAGQREIARWSLWVAIAGGLMVLLFGLFSMVFVFHP